MYQSIAEAASEMNLCLSLLFLSSKSNLDIIWKVMEMDQEEEWFYLAFLRRNFCMVIDLTIAIFTFVAENLPVISLLQHNSNAIASAISVQINRVTG